MNYISFMNINIFFVISRLLKAKKKIIKFTEIKINPRLLWNHKNNKIYYLLKFYRNSLSFKEYQYQSGISYWFGKLSVFINPQNNILYTKCTYVLQIIIRMQFIYIIYSKFELKIGINLKHQSAVRLTGYGEMVYHSVVYMVYDGDVIYRI